MVTNLTFLLPLHAIADVIRSKHFNFQSKMHIITKSFDVEVHVLYT